MQQAARAENGPLSLESPSPCYGELRPLPSLPVLEHPQPRRAISPEIAQMEVLVAEGGDGGDGEGKEKGCWLRSVGVNFDSKD